MRLLAFTLLAWAAFDGPAWLLDRPGLAALGVGFMALGQGRYTPKRKEKRGGFVMPPVMLDRNGQIRDEFKPERVPTEAA